MIEKIEWTDEYLLNVPEIDTQHKKLVELINKLYDLVEKTKTYCDVRPSIVKELIDYTIYHFETEEKFLEKYEYPTLEFHKMQHKAFVDQVSQQANLVDECTLEGGERLYTYLMTWLLNHIGKADKAWSKIVLPKITDNV